jgi:hypothetical protein
MIKTWLSVARGGRVCWAYTRSSYGLEQTLPSLSGWPPKLPHSRCSTAGASGC